MKNKFSFWPSFLSVFILAVAGFWAMAYWSSPEQSSQSSRATASLSTVKLLKLAKQQSKGVLQQKVEMIKRTPANLKEWFKDSSEQVYRGRTYLVSQDVFALPEDQYEGRGEVLQRRQGWVFFKDSQASNEAFELWLDSNNHETLIATGKFLVELEEVTQLRHLQDVYGLEVAYQAPGRPLFLLKADAQKDVGQLIDDLSQERGVIKVERELIGPSPQSR